MISERPISQKRGSAEPNGSVISTEGSAEPQPFFCHIFGLIFGQNDLICYLKVNLCILFWFKYSKEKYIEITVSILIKIVPKF